MVSIIKRSTNLRLLAVIVGIGLLLRIVFLVIGAPAFYHSATNFYFNGDSDSYTLAFENWWRTGHYTFNFGEPDAAVGRLPGYPFFYGLLRVLVGPRLAPAAVAWTQVLLDSGTILLVYGCLRRLVPARPTAALLGALLYATYPFIIIWTPIIGTECLSTDLALLWVYGLLNWRPTARFAVAMGMLLALSLFVREYMAALLPVTLLFVLLREGKTNWRSSLRLSALVGLGFGILYLGWPIRNYLSLNRVVLLKPRTAGYANFTPEVAEYNAWVHGWTNNENPWRDSILFGSPRIHFPADVFPSPADSELAHQLIAQARTCGSGYYVQRRDVNHQPIADFATDTAYQRIRAKNCNEATGTGFAALRTNFQQAFPGRYWSVVPLQNMRKTFLKSDTNATHGGARALLQKCLFAYRSLLLLLGWAGLLLYVRRQPVLLAVGTFVGIIYAYMWFVMRGVEMRYLLQTDVLMLLPAAMLLAHLLAFVGQRFRSARLGPNNQA